MTQSRSGEYRLPGWLYRTAGNAALHMASAVPAGLQHRYLASRSFYQVSSANAVGDYQGVSIQKWHALRLPSSLKGKSVLDIGCSEGFFAQKCAELGASPVLGVDTSLGRLLAASFISQRDRLKVQYRLGRFPAPEIRGPFDYVICLSVIHHSFAHKNLWKVLRDNEYDNDLQTLRALLKSLRSLTANNGDCIVEMPYEYDDPSEERKVVDFNVFSAELLGAGFVSANCLGGWEYNPEHMKFKDRVIYVAKG